MAVDEPVSSQQDGTPPPGFVARVTDALRLLYDPSGLLRSPLAPVLLPAEDLPKRGGHALRAVLLEAVEALNPGPDLPFRSLAARSYQALNLHYVQGHTVDEVARYLAVSMRQTYRDLRKGEADLATLLWRRCAESGRPAAEPDPDLRQEAERTAGPPANVSVLQALRRAGTSLQPLADEAGTRLDLTLPRDCVVRSEATGLLQCFTALLSYAVQAGARSVSVEASDRGDALELGFVCEGVRDPEPVSGLLATADALADAVGAQLATERAGNGVVARLRLRPATDTVILVIDDNAGLAELFQRYLSTRGDCSVVGACEAGEAMRLAKECAPSVIVLDIIMPGADGWAILRQLKSDPATEDIPVLVCSVFRDPQLARSLGAAAFLPKPVSQAALVAALASLGLA